MNKNFNDAKDHFLKEGYCSFSIKDLDLEFATFIEEYLTCDDKKNLREVFTTGRFDSNKFETSFNENTFAEAESVKQKLVDEYDYGNNVSQCWYRCDLEKVNKYLSTNLNYPYQNKHNEFVKYLENKLFNILKYFYDLSDNVQLDNSELLFTLYNKDCRFSQHQDGVGVNYCSMIIYLNKNYNPDNGGLLLLNDDFVIPELFNVALMDLSKHNVRHGVSKVVNDVERYGILYFPIVKNND